MEAHMPSLTDIAWWEDTVARAGRQAVQTVIPVLALAAGTGGVTGFDYGDGLAVAALAALITVLRAVTGLRAPAGASLLVDGADRALAAAAGTALALVATDGFDLLHADWKTIGVAVAGSALLALAAMFTNTPAPPLPPEPAGDAPVIYDYSGEIDTTGDGAA
jgi:hypothetical protein